MSKKYELTKESKTIELVHENTPPTQVIVCRIRALQNFGNRATGRAVQKGDFGGWVQSEDNLSQEGTCWLFDDAIGCENSRRSGDSAGYGNSLQYGFSMQYGFSRQCGRSRQRGFSRQYGYSLQTEDSQQHGHSHQIWYSIQSGDFRHSGGTHMCCSNSGSWDGGPSLLQLVVPHRVFSYDKNTGLINVNNCFIGDLYTFEQAVIRKYGKDYGPYDDAIRMIKLCNREGVVKPTTPP